MTEIDTLLTELEDLHTQATKERSHYYVGSRCKQAIEAIKELREATHLANGVAELAMKHRNDAEYMLAELLARVLTESNRMIAGLRRENDKPFSGLAYGPIEAVEKLRDAIMPPASSPLKIQ